jgi:hypothetical protein
MPPWHDDALKAVIALAVAFISSVLGGHHTAAPPVRTFTVADAREAFKAQTGLRLVRFDDASTAEVTSLRTAPPRTTRFGDFQLFVLRPKSIERMRRVFTHGVNADPGGVYWVPDGTDGWIAVKLLERNLVLAWFPRYPTRELDARFDRLSAAIDALAPEVRIRLRA